LANLVLNSKLTYTNSEKAENIIDGLFLHDIGHPPFGHAGERALNDIMRLEGGFSNSAQTIRLLFDENDSHARYFMTMLDTPALDRRIANDDVMAAIDFFDDLENLIGDLQDLVVRYSCKGAKRLAEEIIPVDILSLPVYDLGFIYLSQRFPTEGGSAIDIYQYIRIFELRDEITLGREEISNLITKHSEIVAHDEIGYSYVEKKFMTVKKYLECLGSWDQTELNRLACDLTAAA
jgi:hypothetical protein